MKYTRTKAKVTLVCRTYRGAQKSEHCIYVNEAGQEFIKVSKNYYPISIYENHFAVVVIRH